MSPRVWSLRAIGLVLARGERWCFQRLAGDLLGRRDRAHDLAGDERHQVLEITDGRITHLHHFLDPELFPVFGLPTHLP